ncbi:MAG: hypothetical protein K0U45_04505 [Alphaproteobacteria bacterium]|nr:hypothetical protein [Alphaproteobacteria bacterium]
MGKREFNKDITFWRAVGNIIYDIYLNYKKAFVFLVFLIFITKIEIEKITGLIEFIGCHTVNWYESKWVTGGAIVMGIALLMLIIRCWSKNKSLQTQNKSLQTQNKSLKERIILLTANDIPITA